MALNLGGIISGLTTAATGAQEGIAERRKLEREALRQRLLDSLTETQLSGLQGQQQRTQADVARRDALRASNPAYANLPDDVLDTVAGRPPAKPEDPDYDLREGVDAEGKPVLYRVPKRGGAAQLVPGFRGAPKTGGLGGQVAGQRKVLATMARNAIDALDRGGQTAPNLIEQAAGSPLGQALGGQYLLSEPRQTQNQAGTQFTEAVLRFTTGAQAPEHELQQYIALLTLRAGDKPGLQAQKLAAQRVILGGLESLAQRGDVNPDEAADVLRTGVLSLGGGPRAAPQSAGEFDEFLQ